MAKGRSTAAATRRARLFAGERAKKHECVLETTSGSYAANGVIRRAGISPLRGCRLLQTVVTLLSGQWREVGGHYNNGRHPRYQAREPQAWLLRPSLFTSVVRLNHSPPAIRYRVQCWTIWAYPGNSVVSTGASGVIFFFPVVLSKAKKLVVLINNNTVQQHNISWEQRGDVNRTTNLSSRFSESASQLYVSRDCNPRSVGLLVL